jgi:hypothetical protein
MLRFPYLQHHSAQVFKTYIVLFYVYAPARLFRCIFQSSSAIFSGLMFLLRTHPLQGGKHGTAASRSSGGSGSSSSSGSGSGRAMSRV